LTTVALPAFSGGFAFDTAVNYDNVNGPKLVRHLGELIDRLDGGRQGVVAGHAELSVSHHRLKNFKTLLLILRLLIFFLDWNNIRKKISYQE
jgi:hypothetical protein